MEFQRYKLSQLITIKNGKDYKHLEEGDVPVFGSGGYMCSVSSYLYDKVSILLPRKGTLSNIQYFNNGKFWTVDTCFYSIINESLCNPYYLYRHLRSLDLSGYDTGASIPSMTQKTYNGIKVMLPSLPAQHRIASILSDYDNLIENNNKRIRLLEQMAENLYKEWFVRFRFPGHENAEFENGLPKGWVVKRMSDFCDVTDGTHDTPKPVDDGVPLITGKCISNGFIDYNEAYSISLEDHEKIKKRSGLSTGDILFSNIGTVGNCCIVDYDREFSVKNVIIFKPNDIIKTAYLYFWMMSDSMQNVFSTQTNGASQQFVGLTFMRRYKILVPEQRILFAFGEKINPLVEQKKKLHRINQNLSRQRDLLLPRLMSGKLEVKV